MQPEQALTPQYDRHNLFLLRVWRTLPGDGAAEWHGKLQRVSSGESCYFSSMNDLAAVLEGLLLPTDGFEHSSATDDVVQREAEEHS